MKYFYITCLLFLSVITQAQIITIPDANFKNALINDICADFDINGSPDGDVDTNNDGEIQVSEAEAVLGLHLSNKGISSFEGIHNFVNLESLFANANSMPSIDVSQNINLRILDCSLVALTELDISQNINLETLYCSFCELTSLDISQNPNLKSLSCQVNQISSLDLSLNPNLDYLACDRNPITSIDLSQNPNLIQLRCSDTPSLTSLNIKNGNNTIINTLLAHNNPGLNCIQVDDVEYANNAPNWFKDPTTIYSENCTLGIEDYDTKNFVLFPNPVKTILNVRANWVLKAVKLYDLQGKLIKECSTNQIDVSELTAGLYFVETRFEDKSIIKKVIKI